MRRISVVVITKNEEGNIARCLESVREIADEILVLDSGSQDQTREICRAWEPRLRWFDVSWEGYSGTKNRGIEMAKSEYVLSLDADEALSPELQQELLAWKAQAGEDSTAYTLNRLTNYCGHWVRHSGWFPDRQLRLFPRELGRWNDRSVHESIELGPGTQTQSLRGLLYHYSFYNLDEHIERIHRYSSLAAEQIAKKKRPFLLLQGALRGPARFLRCYLLKRGFLDGRAGFLIAVLSGYAVFLRYAKASESLRKNVG